MAGLSPFSAAGGDYTVPVTDMSTVGFASQNALAGAPAPSGGGGDGGYIGGLMDMLPDVGLPAPLSRVLGTGGAQGQRIRPQQPTYAKALANKYADPEVAQAYSTLDDKMRRGLMGYDAQRVAGGQPPLTKDETLRAIETIRTGKPATPEPERSVLDIPGNLLSDLGNVIKSVPHIPGAMLSEATHIGQRVNTGHGPIADILSSPGIRMIPGAYTAANLASGGAGVREAVTHPLMTFLDVLPGASKLAEATPVVKAAQEAADLTTGARVRPLGTLLTRRLDEAGRVVPNAAGELLQNVRNDTRIGQAIGAGFGARERAMMRMWEQINQRVDAQSHGLLDAGKIGELTVASRKLMDTYTTEFGWTREQIARMHDVAVTGDPAVLSALRPEEQAYISTARDLSNAYADAVSSEFGGIKQVLNPDSGTSEWFRTDEADRILRARSLASHYERMNRMRGEYLSDPNHLASTPLTAERVNTMLNDMFGIERSGGSKKWMNREARAIQYVLEAHGHDIAELDKLRSAAVHGKGSWAEFAERVNDIASSPGARSERMSVTDIVRELRRHKNDTQAQILATALAQRDTKMMTYALRNIEQRTGIARLPLMDNPEVAATIRSLRHRFKFEQETARVFTDAQTARKATAADEMFSRTTPARFGPRVAADARAATVGRVEEMFGGNLSPDDAGRVVAAVESRRWDALESLGVPAEQLKNIYSGLEAEVASTWRDLAQQGVDPVFVHNVSLDRARAAGQPAVGTVPLAPSQLKERAIDFTPGVRDVGVSLTHQGLEVLSRRGSEEFINWITDNYGVTQRDLQEMFYARAADMAAADPTLDVNGHMQRLVGKSYVKFDPQQHGYTWGGSRLYKYEQDGIFIPKSIAKNLKAMHDPSNPLVAAMNPITRTFRLSVVGLSPRTQLYNVLGGAMMLLGETGPSAFKYAKQAREWVRNPELITDEVLRATIGSQKRAMLDEGTLAVPRANLMAGKTLGRIWQQIQEQRALGKVRDVFGKAIDKSLDLNGFFDDAYRVMGYLYGKDKALTRGLAPEMAERAGMELTRKVMMDWSGLTPFERGVLKQIFPFYGFMNHAMRYVMRFPVDHPLRAEIVGAFGRAEAEDSGVLPKSFLSALFFGGMDDRGNRRAFNTAPINPFGDVANMFTIAGFLSATNPLIGTALESAGLVRGEAELYPTLRYDPETGRLSAAHANPLMMLLENTIPQTQVVSSLLGLNSEFRDRLQRDPAAASRYLMSAAGLPILWRQWNIPAEAAKAEVARGKSAANVRSDAFATGDWSEALRYSSLKDDYQRLLDASPAELAQFMPQGYDIYMAMIEQSYERQRQQATANAQVMEQQTLAQIAPGFS